MGALPARLQARGAVCTLGEAPLPCSQPLDADTDSWMKGERCGKSPPAARIEAVKPKAYGALKAPSGVVIFPSRSSGSSEIIGSTSTGVSFWSSHVVLKQISYLSSLSAHSMGWQCSLFQTNWVHSGRNQIRSSA